MRVKYIEDPNTQWGGTFDVYRNSPYQRGAGLGSIFKSLWRLVVPLAKSVGKTVGKQALKTGARVGSDLLDGKNFEESVTERVNAAVKKHMEKSQEGGNLGKAPTRKSVTLINKKSRKKAIKKNNKKRTKVDIFDGSFNR